jgi:hypothetical protein
MPSAAVFRRRLLLIGAGLALAACSSVKYGDAHTVLIDEVPWSSPERVAAAHCAPRAAVFVQRLPGGPYQQARVLYRCE